MKKKPLLIIAASNFGRLVEVLAKELSYEVAGFIDDTQLGPAVIGRIPDLGRSILSCDFDLVMAIGYNHRDTRLRIFYALQSLGFAFPTLIHSAARVSPSAQLGSGCLLMANADVDAFSTVGEASIIWPNATISHDSVIGAGCFVSPGATLCGNVEVGEKSFVGANCTVIENSHLAPNSFVRAGSLVKGHYE